MNDTQKMYIQSIPVFKDMSPNAILVFKLQMSGARLLETNNGKHLLVVHKPGFNTLRLLLFNIPAT